jgi:hemoglobin/transferrin/lactoferrin receptor protein
METCKKTVGRLFGVLVVGAFPLIPMGLGAADEVKEMEPIVVTASRHGEDPLQAPYLVDVVSQNDLRSHGMPRTTPDALKSVPGVHVQKTSHGQGSPYLRGLTGYYTLFLIDGIRLNNATFRAGNNQYWNTVDPLSIERLEVVKGPSSVLYGSDAIGGTVNAITLRPWGGEGIHGRTYYRFGSAERSNTARQEITGTRGDLAFVAGGDLKTFSDYDAGKYTGIVHNSGYSEDDVDAKAVYFVNPDTEVTMAYQRVDQDNAPRTHATSVSKSYRGTSVGSDLQRELDQIRELSYVQLHMSNLDSFVDDAHASLSFHNQDEVQDRHRSNYRKEVRGYNDSTAGLGLQLGKESSWGRWTYGGEYYRDDVDSFGIDYNADGSVRTHQIQGQVADESVYELMGFYAQDEIAWDEPSLALIPGVRYTRARAVAGETDVGGKVTRLSDNWENVSGSLRTRYDLSQEWNVFGGVSQGFRAPNLSDLSRMDTARSGEVEIPSPGLDPEEFVQYEAGLKSRTDRWEGQVAYYYTDIHNYIDRVPTGNVVSGGREVRKDNTGDGYIQGVELGGSVKVHELWTAFGTAAWQEGQVETFVTSDPASKEQRPLNNMPPASTTLGARWTDPLRKGFWVEGIATFAKEQHRLSPGDKLNTERVPPRGTPGYHVYTLRAGAEVNRYLTWTAAVENLTNEDYRIHGSGQNEPGTNFVLAMEAKF